MNASNKTNSPKGIVLSKSNKYINLSLNDKEIDRKLYI